MPSSAWLSLKLSTVSLLSHYVAQLWALCLVPPPVLSEVGGATDLTPCLADSVTRLPGQASLISFSIFSPQPSLSSFLLVPSVYDVDVLTVPHVSLRLCPFSSLFSFNSIPIDLSSSLLKV